MNVYDQAERFAIKRLYSPGFLRWLLVGLDEDLVFSRWLDTQLAPFPGEPERRPDCVAEFVSRSGKQPPWVCLVEPQGQPQADFLARLLQYLMMLHQELRHGPYGQDRYLMMAGIVNLCEGPLQHELSWLPPGQPPRKRRRTKKPAVPVRVPGVGLTAGVWVRNVYTEPADATLDGIAAGRLHRCLLPWVSVMAGGDRKEIGQRWIEVASDEPDLQLRASFGGLALVLAEKRGRDELWKRILKEWNVTESQIVKEWQKEARKEGREEGGREAMRLSLVRVLRAQFKESLPANVLQVVEQETDLKKLTRWLDIALASATPSAFLASIGRADGNGSSTGG